MDEFAGLKKKSRKKALVADDIVIEGVEDVAPAAPAETDEPTHSIAKAADPADDAVRPLESEADLTVSAEAPLDFSDLKKKKKKAAVALDLEDVETPTTETPPPLADEAPAEPVDDFADLKKKKKKVVISEEPTAEAAAGPADSAQAVADGMEDFSDLKRKKKSKKTVDLEAFTKEIEETAPSTKAVLSTAPSIAAKGADDDDDGDFDGQVDDDDVPEGEDPFARGADGEADVEHKSRAELANEAKAWLKSERDYEYSELLGHFYAALYASHPGLSGAGSRKRFTIPPPSMHRDGNKRSVFANVSDICKRMKRQPEHVIQFLFAELGTTGSVDGSGRLVIKGRFQQKQIENVLRRYIVEYVTCKTCKSPDTLLAKENRLYFVTCQSCGSHRSVSAIQAGFKAQIAKRRAQAAKAAG